MMPFPGLARGGCICAWRTQRIVSPVTGGITAMHRQESFTKRATRNGLNADPRRIEGLCYTDILAFPPPRGKGSKRV